MPKVNPEDYKLAGIWANHVRALVLGDEDRAEEEFPQGHNDGGRAIGCLQQHPAFFHEHYGWGSFPISLSDTWSQAFIKAAASFLEMYTRTSPLDLVIQAYNQGPHAVFVNGVRVPEYLANWKAAFERLNLAQV